MVRLRNLCLTVSQISIVRDTVRAHNLSDPAAAFRTTATEDSMIAANPTPGNNGNNHMFLEFHHIWWKPVRDYIFLFQLSFHLALLLHWLNRTVKWLRHYCCRRLRHRHRPCRLNFLLLRLRRTCRLCHLCRRLGFVVAWASLSSGFVVVQASSSSGLRRSHRRRLGWVVVCACLVVVWASSSSGLGRRVRLPRRRLGIVVVCAASWSFVIVIVVRHRRRLRCVIVVRHRRRLSFVVVVVVVVVVAIVVRRRHCFVVELVAE